MNNLQSQQLLQNISALLDNARKRAAVAMNQTMVLTYYGISRMIVENEQHGENRAEFGKKDSNERKFYEIEGIKNNWCLRELQRYFTVLPGKQDYINILNSDNGKIS
ncbi:DUF1016 N-terminal domain-containing protein [Chryseobacterium daeguense]|uniref:DUF1016 N-terminal domain-containing protein n=1 Tax=Chryseobacterium daeguense TaxID=412438 RepID=UPI00041B9A1E|nr:DUF1016 family protein [Chryseobacterium daeguense]